MRMRSHTAVGLTALAVACVLGAPAAAQDQPPAAPAAPAPATSPPAAAPRPAPAEKDLAVPPTKRKADFQTIRFHLEGTLQHARVGRGYLVQTASVETFQAAGKEIYKAYVQVRDAHAGVLVRIGREEKNKDPLLNQYEKRIQSARSQLLVAMDQANNGARLRQMGRAARGVEFLDKAMHNIQFVLAVMP